MAKNEFYFAGLRFFTEQYPCVIVFKKNDKVEDLVTYEDVQVACEYLCKCRYKCSDKILSKWTRNEGEVANIVYIEDHTEECIQSLLKEIFNGEEKDR